MNKKLLAMAVCLLLACVTEVSAQGIFRRIGQRVKNRVEMEVNHQVDRTVDNAVQGVTDAATDAVTGTDDPETQVGGSKNK